MHACRQMNDTVNLRKLRFDQPDKIGGVVHPFLYAVDAPTSALDEPYCRMSVGYQCAAHCSPDESICSRYQHTAHSHFQPNRL